MSDDNGDAEFEASLANLDVPGLEGSSGQLPGTADPELAVRLDSLHSTLSTLGMRIDALVTSTTTYRSSLTDRLTEYADLVTKLTRTQSNDLEEHRRATERTIADLRRSLGTSEEVLERVGSRLDAMLTESETSDDSARRMLAEVRSILDAQESLSRFITESLDQFADRVLERIDGTQSAGGQQLAALQAAIDEISARDMTRGVRDDLAELRAMVVDLRAQDPSASIGELRENLLDVASGEVVGALWDEVRELRATLDELRSHSVDTVGLLGDLSAKADASPAAGAIEGLGTELASIRDQVSQLVAAGADTASAASIEALRDEIEGVRLALEVARAEAAETAPAVEPVAPEPDPAITSLRDEVSSLVASVRDLLDQAEVVDESAPEPGGGMLTAVAADVAVLRHELSQGLIVEPSDALASTVDELRNDLAQLRDRMQVLADLEVAIEGLAVPAPAPAGGDTAPGWAEDSDAMADEMRSMRSGIEDIIARLDEGLVLADDEIAAPAAAASPALADQLAALKDQISAEFDSLRQMTARPADTDTDTDADTGERTADGEALAAVTELLEHVRDDIAELPDRLGGAAGAPAAPAAAESFATIDPDTVDLLREEIRSAGGVSEQVIDALRKELVALRRRIRLRAEGEIFSEEQLEIIADAVARKLAD